MRRVRMVQLVLLAAVSGCASGASPGDRSPPPASSNWSIRPLPVPPEGAPRPVVEGSAPLTYLVSMPGLLRVVDVGAARVIWEMHAPARTLVAIDERRGLIVGTARPVPGPFPPGGRYAIYLVSGTENVSRVGEVQVAPPPPATMPSGSSESVP